MSLVFLCDERLFYSESDFLSNKEKQPTKFTFAQLKRKCFIQAIPYIEYKD